MRWKLFVGDFKPVVFRSGLLGGVTNLVALETFFGLLSEGELGFSSVDVDRFQI